MTSEKEDSISNDDLGDEWTPASETSMSYNEAMKDLKENYRLPGHPISFMGITSIYRFYNGVLTKKQIKNFLHSTEIYSLTKEEKKNPSKKWTPIVSFHYLDLIQVDLVDVSRIADDNMNIHFLLCAIDVFTRRLWVQPLLNKKSGTVLKAVKNILSQMEHNPSNITSDGGAEFNNSSLKTFLRGIGIKYYVSVSENKCAIVERVQRTLQKKLYSFMINNESLKYIDILQKSVLSYNTSYHSQIKMTPNSAKLRINFKEIQLQNLEMLKRIKQVKPPILYQVGDIVRISIDKSKARFLRSYDIQNSMAKFEIYKISVKDTVHAKYFLKHVYSDEVIKNGWFYDYQLTLCTNPSFRGFIKDTRIRRKKKEYKFSYLGYPEKYDQWKTEEELTIDLG